MRIAPDWTLTAIFSSITPAAGPRVSIALPAWAAGETPKLEEIPVKEDCSCKAWSA